MLPLLLAQPIFNLVVRDALIGFAADDDCDPAGPRIDLDALATGALAGAHGARKLALAEAVRRAWSGFSAFGHVSLLESIAIHGARKSRRRPRYRLTLVAARNVVFDNRHICLSASFRQLMELENQLHWVSAVAARCWRMGVAAIRHVQHVDAGHQFEQLAAEMRRGSDPRRAHGDLARIGFCIGDQLRNAVDRNRRMHLDHVGRAHDPRDRHEVADEIVVEPVVKRHADRVADAGHQKRIAVGRRMGGGLRPDEKVQSSQANSGCMLSGARRVHPVIVGWSTPNRPLIPSPSMMIPPPYGLGQLPGETGSYWT